MRARFFAYPSWIAACGASLVLSACPGDDTAPVGSTTEDTSTTGDATSMSPSPTTTPSTASSSTTEDPSTTEDTTTIGDTTMVADTTTIGDTTMVADTTTATTGTTHAVTTGDTTGSTSTAEGTATSTTETVTTASTTEGDACNAQDLGNAVPTSVLVDTTGAGDDFDPSCSMGMGGEDLVLSWTAPADGTYLFTTARDASVVHDTVLSVFDGDCEGLQLGCNDDYFTYFAFLSSLETIPLAAGQTVAIVVDGYNAMDVGLIELYIDVFPDAGPGGSCCTSDAGVGGCDAAGVEACVCAFAEPCCDTEWNEDCVFAAVEICNAQCSCIESDVCQSPSDDCVCMGCNVDGVCGAADDCIDCVDCAGSFLCGCNLDGACEPYNEPCTCADCADEPVCND